MLIAYENVTIHRAVDQDEGNQVSWVEVALASCSAEQGTKLLDDLEEVANLRHPNLMRCHAQWLRPSEHILYMIQDLIPGNTLRHHLKKIKQPRMRRVQVWASQLLSVLSFLQRQNPARIHGDLNPEKVYVVSHTGDLKVSALGLGTCFRYHSVIKQMDVFTAPDRSSLSPAGDIYAFGMCLLEICTSERPYECCSSLNQVIQRANAGVPPLMLTRIEDSQLRDLIRLCILPEAQRPSAIQLLSHPFFTLPSDDDKMKAPVQLRPVPAFETWEEPKISEDRNINVCITLPQEADSQKVCFEFDMERDTPEAISAEMVKELGLPKHLQDDIMGKIREQLGKRYRPRRRTEEVAEALLSSPETASYDSTCDLLQVTRAPRRKFSRLDDLLSFFPSATTSPAKTPSVLMISTRIATDQENNQEDVRTLQVALNVTLKMKGPVDGRFTKQTAELVRRYQESVGHLVTGVVTRTLWDILMGEC